MDDFAGSDCPTPAADGPDSASRRHGDFRGRSSEAL